jgi:hypothetical protein
MRNIVMVRKLLWINLIVAAVLMPILISFGDFIITNVGVLYASLSGAFLGGSYSKNNSLTNKRQHLVKLVLLFIGSIGLSALVYYIESLYSIELLAKILTVAGIMFTGGTLAVMVMIKAYKQPADDSIHPES